MPVIDPILLAKQRAVAQSVQDNMIQQFFNPVIAAQREGFDPDLLAKQRLTAQTQANNYINSVFGPTENQLNPKPTLTTPPPSIIQNVLKQRLFERPNIFRYQPFRRWSVR